LSAKLQRLKAGQRLTSISASTWDAFVDNVLMTRANGGVNPQGPDFIPTVLKVKNQTGLNLPIHQAVKVGGIVFANPGVQVFQALSLNSYDEVVGIALEPIRLNNIGHVAVTGVVRALVNVTSTTIRNVDWAAGAPGLHSHLAGRHRIVGTVAVPGQQVVPIQLNGNQQSIWRGVAAENLAPGVGGNVTVTYGAGLTVNVSAQYDWMHGSTQISVGKEVLVQFFRDENKWRVIAADCEDLP
jgi:hypothetical protein